MKAILGLLLARPYLSSGIQTETFLVYHLSEYLREASQQIENEAGCRHTYALPSELQNWIIHQKPTRRRIGGGIAAPRGSSWGGLADIYIYTYIHIYIYTHIYIYMYIYLSLSHSLSCSLSHNISWTGTVWAGSTRLRSQPGPARKEC